MEKLIEITKVIAEARSQLVLAVKEFAEHIRHLPDNPNITKVGSHMYVMNYSNLSNSWAPSYYDFKYQYLCIADSIEHSADPIKKLNKIIDTAEVEGVTERLVRIHPDVIQNLQSLK